MEVSLRYAHNSFEGVETTKKKNSVSDYSAYQKDDTVVTQLRKCWCRKWFKQ